MVFKNFMKNVSPLEEERLLYLPKIPQILKNLQILHPLFLENNKEIPLEIKQHFPLTHALKKVVFNFNKGKTPTSFPLRVGVLFSGGQAPGGHNVITGLFDAIKELHQESELIGFLKGAKGLIDNQCQKLSLSQLAAFRNQGGFDLLGSSRTKIEGEENLAKVRQTVKENQLDALVIIGGDDSNTNAAILAENFIAHEMAVSVIGVPKTIDGDLQNEAIEISFGFDSASKTYAEAIGNLLKDAKSSGKYYFFVRLMGRSASHLTLECALKTHPNLALISEEIQALNLNFDSLVNQIADLMIERCKKGKEYGVILIPEGILEFIPECATLIKELNRWVEAPGKRLEEHLTKASLACFRKFPENIQKQLLLDRDPHGNIQVSKIESERLLMELVFLELKKRGWEKKLEAQGLFLGYEGRSCLPSNFDATYAYALGRLAALLANFKLNGYMATIKQLNRPIQEWEILAYPLVKMLQIEERKGVEKAVIKKALVDLKGPLFQQFKGQRKDWEVQDGYLCPGPIQFFGKEEVTDTFPLLLDNASSI